MKQPNNHTKIRLSASAVKKNSVVLALGAELKANFCILRDGSADVYYGYEDLKNPRFFRKYKKNLYRILKQLVLKPQIIAHDLNPVFLSTSLARKLNETSLKASRIVPVQHHYAHAAGALAALGILNKDVIGISCDGTGWGQDGKVWGCEFISYRKGNYRRIGHLNDVALPGADKAVLEPWRVAAALLYRVYGRGLLSLKIPWIKKKKYIIGILIDMIEKNVNTPVSTSAGRLFDGVAGICGIGENIEYEAQAAIALQQQAKRSNLKQKDTYKFSIRKKSGLFVISTDEMIRSIAQEMISGEAIENIAARFHNTFSKMLVAVCLKIRTRDKINDVVVSGGVFFNDIILNQAAAGLNKNKFKVHIPPKLFLGDTGLSLGQAVIAASSEKRVVRSEKQED